MNCEVSPSEVQTVPVGSVIYPLDLTQTVRVYRIQDAMGYGVYSGSGFQRWQRAYHALGGFGRYNPQQPAPGRDSLAGWARTEEDGLSWYFGFATKAALERWFPNGEARAAMLESNKCRPWVFEVSRQHVRFGVHQCVFKRDKAKMVGPLCPLSLEPVDDAAVTIRDWTA